MKLMEYIKWSRVLFLIRIDQQDDIVIARISSTKLKCTKKLPLSFFKVCCHDWGWFSFAGHDRKF